MIERDAFMLRLNVRQAFEAEYVIIIFKCLLNVAMHIIGMFPMSLRQSGGERAVHKDRHPAHRIFVAEFIEQIDQHLSPT